MITSKLWFVNKKRIKISPSGAEKKVISILKKLGIKYKREISFEDCRGISGVNLTFDFLLIDKRILIEYDGEKYHNSANALINDSIKNEFVKKIGYRLLRLTKKDWNNLDERICKFAGVKLPVKNKKIVEKLSSHLIPIDSLEKPLNWRKVFYE